jgi:hypothetical protein
MLSEFAANRIFLSLTATPPHLTTVFRLMCATRPIKIFIVLILLATVFAEKKISIDTSPSLQLVVSLFQFDALPL